jgi:hypothetical protein
MSGSAIEGTGDATKERAKRFERAVPDRSRRKPFVRYKELKNPNKESRTMQNYEGKPAAETDAGIALEK